VKHVSPLLAAVLVAACAPLHHRAVTPAPLDRAGLDSLIGREWRGDSTLIPSAQYVSGWLIRPRGDTTTYSLALLVVQDRPVVAAQREVGRVGEQAVWRTTDVAWLPPAPAGFVMAASCAYHGEADGSVFAQVAATDTPWYGAVRRAWRLETPSGRLRVVGRRGVRCRNEGYGAP